ncbi:hypothetical protein ACFQZC_19430 [Streptacidiphilus monticola]
MQSAAQAQQALTANKFPMPKGFAKDSSKSGYVGYLVDLATNNLLRSGVSRADLDKGGYTIWTTFDKKAMDDMKAAVDGTFKGKLDPKRTVVNTVDDRARPSTARAIRWTRGSMRAALPSSPVTVR